MPRRQSSLLAFAGFIMLGIPLGAIGVAWPSMADSFDQDLARLGVIAVASTVGFVIATTASGHVSARTGTGPMVAIAATLASASLFGHAIAPTWWLLLLAAALFGLGGGFIDAGVNAHGAVRFNVRTMNLLHASFGIGATIGPLLMAALLGLDASWRVGFVILGVLQAGVAVGFWRTRTRWAGDGNEPLSEAPSKSRVPVTVLVLSLVVFFLYTGVEVAAGQWTFSLFSEERGMSEGAAGVWIAVYWGAFTASRLLIGVVGDGRLGREQLVRWSLGLAGLAALIVWLDQGPVLGPIGLAVMGFAFGPVFPALVLLTPDRVGNQLSARMVGYQISAANLGAAGVVGGIGLAVGLTSLKAVGPLLFAGAALIVLFNELLQFRVTGSTKATEASAS